MTIVLACGEGPHDIGRRDWSASAACHVQVEGWVQPILRKVFGEPLEIKTMRLRDISLVPNPKLSGLTGHGRRAALAKFIAKTEGCERVVFVADADSNDTSIRAERLKSIVDGFEAVQNGILGTGCVPQSTSESWILADKQAWTTVAPAGAAALPSKSPESLWGAVEDPSSNHPKQFFERVCEAANCDPDRETRLKIAEVLDLDELERRCPESVKPFIDGCKNPT